MKSYSFKWLITGICLFSMNGHILSQENVRISKNAFRTGITTGYKEAWESVKEGDRNYKGGLGTYQLARDHYLFANQYNPENAALNYKLGICYLFTDNKYEAIDYLLHAYTLDDEVSSDIHLMLGMAYQLVLEFDKAMEQYNMYSSRLDPKKREKYSKTLAKQLDECMYGKNLSREPVRVIIQPLGEEVNSKYDDYNPVFTFNDTALIFTSRRPYGKGIRNSIDNKFNEDIYISSFDNGVFQNAVRLNKPFNTANNDAVVGVSTNGRSWLLYKGAVEGGDIQVTSYLAEKEKWKHPRGLKGSLTSNDGETSACFSPDGKELYFVSRNRKFTLGEKDILYTRLNGKGKWSKPRNLGLTINTPYNEEGVFITPDDRYLYFASEGHNSMGGFDIFRSERGEDGKWMDPVNLGYPVNTPDDEVFYITDQTGRQGYYSAIREGGAGEKDICRVVFLGSEKAPILKTEEQLVAGTGPEKTGFLSPPVLNILDNSLQLYGTVADTIDGMKPVVAKLAFFDPGTGERSAQAISDNSGSYSVSLPGSKDYAVEINASGYLYYLDILDLSSASPDVSIHRDFFLQRVEVGTKVVLEHIYFEINKAILRPESYAALDQVYRFLQNNPTVKLEISGHTDNTGTLRLNQRLSTDRAKAVVDYLVERGIPQEMLDYKGYAYSQPVATNSTAEGRSRNRRVEFKVISK